MSLPKYLLACRPVGVSFASTPTRKLSTSLPFLILLLGLWSACKDDFIHPQKPIEVTFMGQIVDEQQQPISGAQVHAGGQSALTDANGVFRLPTVRLPGDNARLRVRKAGYFEFARAYVVEDKAMQSIVVQLLAKQQSGVFAATQGGVVQVLGGPTLTFPANGVTTGNSMAYNGMVVVHARYLDPTDPDLALYMPGDLRGINTAGEEQSLATFGMVAVEISGAEGEELKIAAASEVEMSIPIAASQAAVAPSNIPLWHFDLDRARWIEEGVAYQAGNQYVGKVKHFSVWNYDASFPSVMLRGRVFVGDEQRPLANAVVKITSSGLSTGYGYTDADGFFGGAVPKGAVLTLQIFELGIGGAACSTNAIHTQTIGPFDSDATLPSIILSSADVQLVTVNGRLLDCAGQPVVNGYAKIALNSGVVLTAFTASDGTFRTSFIYCSGLGTTAQVTAYDLKDFLESAVQPFNVAPGTITLGDLAVCTALGEYIRYTLDGQDFTLLNPQGGDYQHANETLLGASANTPPNTRISLIFYSNQQPGTFPLSGLRVNQLETDPINILVNTTVTAFGLSGQPIVGTFGGTFQSLDGSSHSIDGSYRVIRK